MREPNSLEEVAPIRLNTSELRIMALRQQQQIDTQQQLLAAREQRLRFLKVQEACETVAAAEGERLRRLRERVEAQESKLRRLRALRGQVDLQKTYNVTLGNDLDSIRALFSEKEKELTLAVAKVEALTRQLEELRRDRRGPLALFPGVQNHVQLNNSPASIELDKLRRELMYRNQLSLQQDARLHLQREALQKRQNELQSVDQRILELQGRLNKKRTTNMIPQTHTSSYQAPHGNNSCATHVRSVSSSFYPQHRVPRSNVVAVEPFNHIPQKAVALGSNGNKVNILNNSNNSGFAEQPQIAYDAAKNKYQHGCHIPTELLSNTTVETDHSMVAESDENKLAAKLRKRDFVVKSSPDFEQANILHAPQSCDNNKISNENEHNDDMKFTYSEHGIQNDELISKNKTYINQEQNVDNNGNMCANSNEILDSHQHSNSNECDSDKVSDLAPRTQLSTTVHSTPLSFLNKSVAVPVTLANSSYDEQQSLLNTKSMQSKNRNFPHAFLHNIPSGNLVVPPRKPNSTTTLSASRNGIADVKVHMVSPQTQTQNISDTMEKMKPALPPKPNKATVMPYDTEMMCKANLSENNDNNEHPSIHNVNMSKAGISSASDNLPIKARPLTIKKSPYSEQPRLKHASYNNNPYKYQQITGAQRLLEAHASYSPSDISKSDDVPEDELSQTYPVTDIDKSDELSIQMTVDDQLQPTAVKRLNAEEPTDQCKDTHSEEVSRRKRSFASTVITDGKIKLARRVSFDPLALLLDASLEGELELVQKTALQVPNPSAANDEGITALHNAICAGHVEIVKFLVNFGCDVNAQDSDGWTPLHCAASCNNLSMVKFLVESGACLFASTLSDHETPAEKCEEDEEGFDGCSEYLYSIQEKLGILHNGEVYAVFSYDAQQIDELSFSVNDKLTIIRKGDESEREWWWAKDHNGKEGYIPRNLLGFYPRISPSSDNQNE